MIRLVILLGAAAALTACVGPKPYEVMPVSTYQWQQRQDRIQREETERLNRCETMNKQSERYARECQRPGGAPQ